jgi:hypothetical protein
MEIIFRLNEVVGTASKQTAGRGMSDKQFIN